MKALAFAAGLTLGAASTMAQTATAPIGANVMGDFIIKSTGLDSDGFTAMSAPGTEDDRKLYMYTGTNPGSSGEVLFYMANQPANEHAFMTLTLGVTDPAYIGTFSQQLWPLGCQLQSSYWIEQPTLIAIWQCGQKLVPHAAYTIFVHAPPRRYNPVAQGITPPAQGSGAGVIQ